MRFNWGVAYFTDRDNGPSARNVETVSQLLWGGVVSAVSRRVASGAFGRSFPELCPDGNAVVGVGSYDLGLAVRAEVPALAEAKLCREERWSEPEYTGWPLDADRLPATGAVLDLVEFCFHHVAEPTELNHHSYYSHHHLTFDVDAGRLQWMEDMNSLFARNSAAYELTGSGEIVRLGTPVVGESVRSVRLKTGEEQLDDLLERARSKYLSPDPVHRRESLEQLWDAFERTKTIRDPDKKAGIGRLLAEVASSPATEDLLQAESRALTSIGNDFCIRHHETTRAQISADDVDWLFHRCFAFLAKVLDLNPSR